MRITLGPFESKPVTVAGGQFYLLSAFSKVAVKIVSGGDSRVFELSSGMGFKAREGERFFGVEIKDLGGVGQTIDFEISDREVFDNRTVGVVEVVNSSKRRTEEKIAFMSGTSQDAVASKYSYAVLCNPANSGKLLIVNRVIVGSEAGNLNLFGIKDVVAFLGGVGVSVTNTFPVTSNKWLGAGVSVAEFKALTVDNLAVGNSYIQPYGAQIGSVTNWENILTEPFVIPENMAIGCRSFAVASKVQAVFEFFEENKS